MKINHYERVIAACCFLFIFVNIGMPSTSFSVYQPYIVAMPGVGDTGGSFVLMTRTTVTFIAMFLVNIFYDRLDVRMGVSVATLLTAAGFVVFSFAETLPVLCLAAGIAGFGYGLGGMVAMTLLVSRWYKSHVGRVLGIGSVGSGVASIIIPIVALQLIHNVSLAFAFRCEAALAAVIAIVLFALLRDTPQSMGLEPYHSHEKPGKKNRHAEVDFSSLTRLPQGMRVLLMMAMACIGMMSVGGMGYLSVLYTTEGYDHVFAGTLISVAGLFLALSKYATGEIIDHLGPRRGSSIMFVVLIIGFGLCTQAPVHNNALAVAAAVFFGVGCALGTVGISIWSLELTDEEHRAKTIRNFQICYALGGMIVNAFPGALKELTGSYVPTYMIMLGCAVFAFAIIFIAYYRYRRELG